MSDDNRFVTFTSAADIPPHPRCSDWGPWRLNPDTRVIYTSAPSSYEIDLDSCTSSAEVLDWICQIAGKSWADDATPAGLVRALDDILIPQANLCSCGRSTRISVPQITGLVDRAVRRGEAP